MRRSSDRFLTTHVGSLPRPDDLLKMMTEKDSGHRVDPTAFSARVQRAVAEIVKRQVEIGVDVIDDGEQGKASFVTYANERLGGIEPGSPARQRGEHPAKAWHFPSSTRRSRRMRAARPRERCRWSAPVLSAMSGRRSWTRRSRPSRPPSTAPAPWKDFLPAISPTNVEAWQRNEYYKSNDEFLFAIAEAMRVEYEAIVAAGVLLQIDDPGLATHYARMPDLSVEDCRRWARVRVQALNHALRNIPPEKVRFHTCYSINMGPRVSDMELKDLVDIMLEVRAGAFSFEAANPRHEHEWRVWADVKLADGRIIIPGVISHTTVLVEHPELVAERILRFAQVVGCENVIAGADCGFASFAASHEMHPTIVWAKLAALAAGARIASRRMWLR
jgi:5-methyltetrahydropteroyltriglutamate--homocysteine methyltransferase